MRFLIPGEGSALSMRVIRPQHELDHSQVLIFKWTKPSDSTAGSTLPTGSSTHCAGVGQEGNLALSSISFHFITLSSSRVLQTLKRPFKTFADAPLINQISLSWILSCAPSSSWAVGAKSCEELSPHLPSHCLPKKSFKWAIFPVWAQVLLANLFFCYSLTRFISPLSKWQL